MHVLPDVQAREDELHVQAESVFRIETEVCAQAYIVVVGISRALEILADVISCCLDISLETAVYNVILVACVVVEAV